MSKKYKSTPHYLTAEHEKLTDKQLEQLIEKSTISASEYNTESHKDSKVQSNGEENKKNQNTKAFG